MDTGIGAQKQAFVVVLLSRMGDRNRLTYANLEVKLGVLIIIMLHLNIHL